MFQSLFFFLSPERETLKPKYYINPKRRRKEEGETKKRALKAPFCCCSREEKL